MKQKKLQKKNLFLFSRIFLSLTLCPLIFCSCSFQDDAKPQEKTDFVIIKGSLVLQGAVPSSLVQKNQQNRSAVPSLPEGISYSVKAEDTNGNTSNPTNITDDGQFEIKLTKGEWTICGEILKDSDKILTGYTNVEITDNFPIKKDIEIIAKPDSSTGSGTVNLPIFIEETSGIKSAEVRWQASSGTTGTQTLDFSSSTSAVFTMGGTAISSGAYTAVFQFYSSEADGKRLLYQCTETINVCSNLCTDSWLKNGTNSSPWLTESDGKVTFTVTKSFVEKFAQTSFFVQGTGGTYTPKTIASDTNNGTYFDPLSTVQKAVDNIIQINDETTEYSIFIDGTVTAPDTLDSSVTPNFIKIEPKKKLNLTIASLSSTQAEINANTKAGVIDVVGKSETEKTTLVLQNVCITGGKTQSSGVGGGIKAESADITLKAGTVIGTKLLPEENEISSIASSSTYGNYAAKGGGIYLNGSTLTIEDDVYICQNYSENEGGGIAAEGNSTIIATGGIIGFNQAGSNTAENGGGIYINGGSCELTACTVCMNKAVSNGAGIYVAGGSVTLTDCTFSDNEATSNGGGIYIDNTDAVVTISDSTISENNAQTGAGIYLNNGALTISSTTMEKNTATSTKTDYGGGAIYSKKTITFTNCTFSDNSALYGKAINFYNIVGTGQTLNFNGKIQTNEDDIYFMVGNRFLIQTPLSAGSSILVTPSNYGKGTTILAVKEGVTLADQVDYFKVTPNSNETQYGVNFNGKLYEFKKIEELNNFNPDQYTLVSISTADGFNKVIGWLNTSNTLKYITLLLENDLDLGIQIPSNFEGTLNGNGHTITGTNQSYTTLFESSSADFINLKVDGYYQKPRPLTAAENVAIFTNIPAGQNETVDASTLDETNWSGAGSAEISGNVTLTATTPTTISSAGNIFTVKNGGTLTLSDNVTLSTAENPVSCVKVEEGGTLIIDGAKLTSSSTTNPTGVSITTGTLIMNSGTISGITGSPLVATDSTITITGGTISNNSTKSSLQLTNCKADIQNLTVTDNSAMYNGGAIKISGGGTYSFTNCQITDNSTGPGYGEPGYGGGIYIDTTGTVTFTGCTITGNTAKDQSTSSKGGGIYLKSGTLTTTGCTINSNTTKNGSTETTGSGSQIYAVPGSVYNEKTLKEYMIIDTYSE